MINLFHTLDMHNLNLLLYEINDPDWHKPD